MLSAEAKLCYRGAQPMAFLGSQIHQIMMHTLRDDFLQPSCLRVTPLQDYRDFVVVDECERISYAMSFVVYQLSSPS
jgi:hypothetical protein